MAAISENGTGDKLDLPTAMAAQIKGRLAIADLLQVQSGGTNVTALIALLRQLRCRTSALSWSSLTAALAARRRVVG